MEENNNKAHETVVQPTSAPKVEMNTLMGVLAYLGPLVIISYLVAKDNPFVKFHIKQGLVLICIQVIVWILSPMSWGLWSLLRLVNLAVLVLTILGIVNVVQKKEKELPLVGSFASYFKF